MAGNGETRQGREALRRFLVGQDNLDDALTKMAVVTVETVPGADLSSVTILRNGKPHTPAFSEKTALDLDESQYEAGDGPCLAAIREGGVLEVAVASDDRWPEFKDAATQAGITGTLSLALLSDEEVIGGLNIYSRSTPSFPPDAREEATELAAEVAVVVANVLTYEEAAALSRQLQEALESRAAIEQAKGILMGSQRCSAEDAFDVLRRASQRENRKLRDIAQEIVDRAQQPR